MVGSHRVAGVPIKKIKVSDGINWGHFEHQISQNINKSVANVTSKFNTIPSDHLPGLVRCSYLKTTRMPDQAQKQVRIKAD